MPVKKHSPEFAPWRAYLRGEAQGYKKTLFGYSVWLTNELKNERSTAGFGIMLQVRKFRLWLHSRGDPWMSSGVGPGGDVR